MPWPFSTTSSSHHRPSTYSHTHSQRPSSSRASSSYSRHSSYYKRSARPGYIARLLYKLKHLLRELYYYARRHPAKVFFLVVMPLISGGVLANLAGAVGVRLPSVLMGNGARVRGGAGGGYYGSVGYGSDYGRKGHPLGGLGGLSGLMKVAQAFM